jgi:rhamnulose-1-phosphate aldolase/alcohol dehydrogenase
MIDPHATKKPMLADRWDDSEVAGKGEAELLLHRSRLLGSDPSITNFGGGNTSAKIPMRDPLTGEAALVLWVKGSGADLGSLDLAGFATLYEEKLLTLEGLYRGRGHEDEMVAYLAHCTFGLNPCPASIDTPLHALLPFAHVDHVHPDAVLALAAARGSERLTHEVYEGRIGWLPWQRPGFDLALRLRDLARRHPEYRGVVLAAHGLITWGDSSRDCYRVTLDVIRRARRWLDAHGRSPAFGGVARATLPERARGAVLERLLPALRGALSGAMHKVGYLDSSEAVLEFCGSRELHELAALGTSCPDHFLRTKIRPLVLDEDPEDALAGVEEAVARYRADYEAYYGRCRRAGSPPMRDPNPVVCLLPGIGMATFAADRATARRAAEFYGNAIQVMRGASSVDEYVGLEEQEAFDIEYWDLEEAKLRRKPTPGALAGRIAYVTGGGGGIGRATADRLLREGACVVLVDRDATALADVRAELSQRFGGDLVRSFVADVSDEAAVQSSFGFAVREYGGLDVVVSNAGIACASPIEETSLETWQHVLSVLATGYFLVGREAIRVLKAQGIGGSIVFVASKNGLVASPGAAAYGTAKASELHLARCLALEGAVAGIRVNAVNPDAVLRGSRIWSGEWRNERAEAHGIAVDEVEEHYRSRSLLKREVYPEDVAEAVFFFASDLSAKSTGNILNVDAGNAAAFTR